MWQNLGIMNEELSMVPRWTGHQRTNLQNVRLETQNLKEGALVAHPAALGKKWEAGSPLPGENVGILRLTNNSDRYWSRTWRWRVELENAEPVKEAGKLESSSQRKEVSSI